MPKHLYSYGKLVVFCVLMTCLFWGCADEPEKAKSTVVSKKIAAKPSDVQASKQTQSSENKTMEATKDSNGGDKQIEPVIKKVYDPKQRLNPFIPLYKAQKAEIAMQSSDKKKRKKREPRTPLERISLAQLKLVAIIRAESANRALVEDASGKGFIIKSGTYIGLNSGIVKQINSDSVIVEEENENLLGELILENIEMKLQKPPGE